LTYKTMTEFYRSGRDPGCPGRWASQSRGAGGKMSLSFWEVAVRFVRDADGQDLIEYALIVALIAFAATVGMNAVATQINAAFVSVGSKLTNYIS